MSEITLTPKQLEQATKILWNLGQFRPDHTTENEDIVFYRIACDADDIHEYLADAGLIMQDSNADATASTDAFQWLSDDSVDVLYRIRVRYQLA